MNRQEPAGQPEAFAAERMSPASGKWEQAVCRGEPLYSEGTDIRSPFDRDYTRIIHCTAYRRLKHKTQVFFATSNDHVCTRIEHVAHVASVSGTIAKFLGLNVELTGAIATGHDLGHAPFGHCGEKVLADIHREELQDAFWHERNGLWFVDGIETLVGPDGKHRNLDLTYAVRDGIICHCGEVDEHSLRPRPQAVDLHGIERASQHSPFTWEGCVVKVADKIAYLGRDIEDARELGLLGPEQTTELEALVLETAGPGGVSNARLINDFILDLCRHSSPEAGITLSPGSIELMRRLKAFNYAHIYLHPRLDYYRDYVGLLLRSIYQALKELYAAGDTLRKVRQGQALYPVLCSVFADWLEKYSDLRPATSPYMNLQVYEMADEASYRRSVLDFIAGMTDQFAVKVFGELTSF